MATPSVRAAADPVSAIPSAMISEDANRAPIDFGLGPGVKRTPLAILMNTLAHPRSWTVASSPPGPRFGALSTPVGTTAAGVIGFFGPPIPWPLVAVHDVLLPTGQVMSYGTDSSGHQGASLVYDVWNPELGTGLDSHLVLPNTTSTNIFCSAQSVDALTGNVLITGGARGFGGVGGLAINNTTLFTPQSTSIKTNPRMNYPRWYDTLTGLPDGSTIVLGGRRNDSPATGTWPPIPATAPERYVDGQWVALTGAASEAASRGDNWYYPRVAVTVGGDLFMLAQDGTMYLIDPAGTGAITAFPQRVPDSSARLPVVPFAPGKMLYLASGPIPKAMVVDYGSGVPTATTTGAIDQFRYDATGTILADGEVLISGGSSTDDTLAGADYRAAIWNPATGVWNLGARATVARLYHSTALLLPDGSVLTAGGGVPGPVTNMNAEIYYPPYLYAKGGGGRPATRPTLTVYAPPAYLGDPLAASVGNGETITRLTLLRTGSSTHSNNVDQRFIELGFTQTGQALKATLPADPSVLVPGYYMLFAFDLAGVPSVSTMLHIRPR
jgi:hypothetical protein